MAKITKQLLQWRQGHALTQAEAARLFGVHHITYTRWETGARALEGAARRLAHVLQEPEGLVLAQRIAQREEGL